jgi:small subunit ribosomal protein S6
VSANYEAVYILRPDLSEDQVEESMKKYSSLIEANGGKEIVIAKREKRRLAYNIGKHRDGIYIYTHFLGGGQEIAPLERAMRLSEDVIRYLTLKLEPPKAVAEKENDN